MGISQSPLLRGSPQNFKSRSNGCAVVGFVVMSMCLSPAIHGAAQAVADTEARVCVRTRNELPTQQCMETSADALISRKKTSPDSASTLKRDDGEARYSGMNYPDERMDEQGYKRYFDARQERHRQQQRNYGAFVVAVVSVVCIFLVVFIAFVTIKVYASSLHDQLSQDFGVAEVRRPSALPWDCEDESVDVDADAFDDADVSGQQELLRSVFTCSRLTNHIGRHRRGTMEQPQYNRPSEYETKRTHQTYFDDASRSCSVVNNDYKDPSVRNELPTVEDIVRACSDRGLKTGTKTSAKVQELQNDFERRCGDFFLRLKHVTPPENKESSAEDNFSGDAVEPLECVTQQEEVLSGLKQLFTELDSAFSTNRPAHVTAMIKCCNILLQHDGLMALKRCADDSRLHDKAQSIIEIVVPCIWAT